MRRKLRKKLTRILTTKLHSTLSQLYNIAYHKEDSLLICKYTILKDITPADIGIDKQYWLVQNSEDNKSESSCLQETTTVTKETTTTTTEDAKPEDGSEQSKDNENTNTDDTNSENPGTNDEEENVSEEVHDEETKGETDQVNIKDPSEASPPESSTTTTTPPKKLSLSQIDVVSESILSEDELEEKPLSASSSQSVPFYGPNGEPYFPVINNLRQLPLLKTPSGKLRLLLKASKAILACVDSYYNVKTKSMFMGAEDKFPVLIYAVIKANIPLYAEYHYLEDFINAGVADPESSYRIEELLSVLKYVSSLDLKIRDESGVLIPLNLIEQRLVWKHNQAKMSIPEKMRRKATRVLFRVFEKIADRDEEGTTSIYEPLQLSKELPYEENIFVTAHPSFFTTLFEVVGLQLEQKQDTQPDQVHSINYKNYHVVFKVKYPLFIYMKLIEALTEHS
eukprot:TRINITY_DN2774_c0_g1_i2.p1 TRINITY_DN2774_c0_g1~~TRINITY_DN2774_c0_g1_i2.p1  ORF type:complete len:452 (-),score=115.60 TRINITY_DN2774_c0_g1_i2:12-1367(-)